jgi:hypothetical protein
LREQPRGTERRNRQRLRTNQQGSSVHPRTTASHPANLIFADDIPQVLKRRWREYAANQFLKDNSVDSFSLLQIGTQKQKGNSTVRELLRIDLAFHESLRSNQPHLSISRRTILLFQVVNFRRARNLPRDCPAAISTSRSQAVNMDSHHACAWTLVDVA